ncbi:hypothetical protein FOYG_17425 [Fusarium oxysporum NRRL 32931]|uniref:Uncharacterized protein n=1 Tax=Fusarium oxysporum NRRL 32931 TaxID=660029 RepID=W9HEN8_FUSOX|nr:hypothetical protein FOYG_17425 [Fusarium oxysporum NRRL 32931]
MSQDSILLSRNSLVIDDMSLPANVKGSQQRSKSRTARALLGRLCVWNLRRAGIGTCLSFIMPGKFSNCRVCLQTIRRNPQRYILRTPSPFALSLMESDLWPTTPAGIDKSAVLVQVGPDRCPELSLSKVRQLKLAVEACISTIRIATLIMLDPQYRDERAR